MPSACYRPERLEFGDYNPYILVLPFWVGVQMDPAGFDLAMWGYRDHKVVLQNGRQELGRVDLVI